MDCIGMSSLSFLMDTWFFISRQKSNFFLSSIGKKRVSHSKNGNEKWKSVSTFSLLGFISEIHFLFLWFFFFSIFLLSLSLSLPFFQPLSKQMLRVHDFIKMYFYTFALNFPSLSSVFYSYLSKINYKIFTLI